MKENNKKNFKDFFKKDNLIGTFKWFFYSFIWVALAIFVIDIVTKTIVNNCLVQNEYVTVIPNFFYLQLIYNRGAGYGLINNLEPDWLRRLILIGISLVMTAAFITVFVVKFKKLRFRWKIALMVLAGGAFGNLIDRAFYPDGAVIDFLVIKINNFIPFGSFNVADIALSLGIVYVIILFIIDEVVRARKIDEKLNAKIVEESKNNQDSQSFSEKAEEKQEEKQEEKNDEKSSN